LKSELFSELGASATMFDIGALAEFGKWNFGAGLNNINGALKYNGIDEKIPQVMRAGILYKNFFEDIFLHYSLGVDYVKAGTETFLRAGAEAVYNNLLAGRAGYEKGNNGDGGFAFGVGIMYMEFSLEYAFNYYSGAKQSAHKIGLVYKFLKDGGGEKDGAKNKKSGKAGKKGLRDFTEEDLIEELNKRLKNENAVAASTPDVSVAPAPSAPIKYDDGDDPGAANVPIVQTAPEQPAPSELYAPATGAEPKTDDSETITKSNYFSFIGSKIYLNPQKPAEQYYSLGGDSIGDEYAGQILTIENISLSPRGDSLLLYLSDKKENILVKTARLGNGGHAEFSNIFLIRKDKINAGKND
ncbi:MAG: hypothetical protein LBL61_04995, partial [Elusimicrobiota bacterium]|nr:hypothetical protein [Elusimicrobiota bacterium]